MGPRGQQISIPKGLPVLVIDNDKMILESMKLLMSGWRCKIYKAKDGARAPKEFEQSTTQYPLIIADYHLDHETGLDAIQSLPEKFGLDLPAILLTADRSKLVRERPQAEGILLLHKSMKPASLRSVIVQSVLAMKTRSSAAE